MSETTPVSTGDLEIHFTGIGNEITTDSPDSPMGESGESVATREPDFVWVGCSTCWQAQDQARPVLAYAAWLERPMRHADFVCPTCSLAAGRPVTSFPTLYGLDLESAYLVRAGGLAPASSTVSRWGG